MAIVDLDPNDVCHCGDYRSWHPGGVGPCGLCARSRAPYDVCRGFVFAYHDAERGTPITRRQDSQTPAVQNRVQAGNGQPYCRRHELSEVF